MTNSTGNTSDSDIPASLRRGKEEPMKFVHVSVPVSWWQELSTLAQEFDQHISVFLREAIEDWLQRARKVQNSATSASNQGCVK